jgi:hypothetical protein
MEVSALNVQKLRQAETYVMGDGDLRSISASRVLAQTPQSPQLHFEQFWRRRANSENSPFEFPHQGYSDQIGRPLSQFARRRALRRAARCAAEYMVGKVIAGHDLTIPFRPDSTLSEVAGTGSAQRDF